MKNTVPEQRVGVQNLSPNSSLWSETITLPAFEPLNKSIKTEVLIIGGGIAGILCAHFLHQSGVPYILVEADTICSGITKNTTAKITSQHGLIYHKIEKSYGTDAAGLYLEANETALTEYSKLTKQVSCDFEFRDNYVYTLSDIKKLEQELKTLEKLRFPASFAENLPLPLATAGAVRFPRQAQFHPLKFLSELARPLHIYEHTKVTELIKNIAITNHHKIMANSIIIATHFPIINKHGSYFIKQYQHRSYVLGLKDTLKTSNAGKKEPTPLLPGMYVDESEKGMSFRSFHDTLLLGGGGHRTGKKGGNWNELREFADFHYPMMKETVHWATQDCITLDGIPYIGQYSKNTPHLYVATGFNKWGMTAAMVAGKLLCDLITEKETPYASVFSPSRSIWHPKLFVNGLESTVNLLTPTNKRCPHLGCALKWNKAEHTWDCPCHGSRFAESGKLIDNPATDDLKQ